MTNYIFNSKINFKHLEGSFLLINELQHGNCRNIETTKFSMKNQKNTSNATMFIMKYQKKRKTVREKENSEINPHKVIFFTFHVIFTILMTEIPT